MSDIVALRSRRPSPLDDLLQIEAVDAHRDIWCRHYDGCLEVAVQRGWISWSCACCPLRGQAQVKPEMRVQADSALADVPEAWSPTTRPNATMRIVYQRLSNRPMTSRAIARGQYRESDVLSALRSLAAKGLVVETSKGWKRTGERICAVCRQRLPASAFSADCFSIDGLSATCRECRNRRRRRRRK